MTVNKSEQTLENRLINRIADLDRELSAIKTRQLNGGDNIVFDFSSAGSVLVSVAANSYWLIQFSLSTSGSATSVFPQFLFTPYLSTTSDSTRQWPFGSAITASEVMNTDVIWRYDMMNSTNWRHRYHMAIRNNTASPIDVYVLVQYYYPRVALA